MIKEIQEEFDVLVIGGGAAGLMAAAQAAQKGARVALVEKNDRYGIKLLMTGNGRCNVSQESENMVEFAKFYNNGRFLLSALNAFSPSDMRAFLEKNGVKTKVEKSGRIFPASDQSKDVRDALYEILRQNNVTFFNTEEVVEIQQENGKITRVITKRKEISARNYILATGGKSYPNTGSSGDGYAFAKKIGHTIIDPKPVLVPAKTVEMWVEELQGVSVNNCQISVIQNSRVLAKESGDLMFAHFGLSGPVILNASRVIEKMIANGEIKIVIDFKPYLSFEQLDEIVLKDFEKNAGKNFCNCLQDLFSPKLREFLLQRSGIPLEIHAAKISKKQRQLLVRLCKTLTLTVENLFGFEKAMVTSGGISIKEIDSKTMQSRIISNLYFAGEVVDVDGPTGGYNLQMCWSTGYVAGQSAVGTNS